MAGTITIGTLSDGTNSGSATDAIKGSARAWVNFNGIGTVAIRASYNVSSITDNGTGQYNINFTNAMTDANYACASSAALSGGSGLDAQSHNTANRSTTYVYYQINDASGNSAEDTYWGQVTVFR